MNETMITQFGLDRLSEFFLVYLDRYIVRDLMEDSTWMFWIDPKKGSLAKRMKKALHKNGVKITCEIGNEVADFCNLIGKAYILPPVIYDLVFLKDVPKWDAGDFSEDPDSCFWGCNKHHYERLKASDAQALRIYNENLEGKGRAWVLPHEEGWAIFNNYGPMTLDQMALLLQREKGCLNIPNTRVDVECPYNPIYVNGERAVLVGIKNPPKSIRLDIKTKKCPKCGSPVDHEGIQKVEIDGVEYCGECALELKWVPAWITPTHTEWMPRSRCVYLMDKWYLSCPVDVGMEMPLLDMFKTCLPERRRTHREILGWLDSNRVIALRMIAPDDDCDDWYIRIFMLNGYEDICLRNVHRRLRMDIVQAALEWHYEEDAMIEKLHELYADIACQRIYNTDDKCSICGNTMEYFDCPTGDLCLSCAEKSGWVQAVTATDGDGWYSSEWREKERSFYFGNFWYAVDELCNPRFARNVTNEDFLMTDMLSQSECKMHVVFSWILRNDIRNASVKIINGEPWLTLFMSDGGASRWRCRVWQLNEDMYNKFISPSVPHWG